MSIEADCPVCDGQGYIDETAPPSHSCDVIGKKCLRCSGLGSVEVEITCSVCDNGVTEDGIGYCSQKCFEQDFDSAFNRKLERVLRLFESQAKLCRDLEQRYSPGGVEASWTHAVSLACAYQWQAEQLEKILAELKSESTAKVA